MFINKQNAPDDSKLSTKKINSIVAELPETAYSKELVRIAELSLHNYDVYAIAEDLGMTIPEVISLRETVDYYKAEQAVSRHLGQTVANKLKVLLNDGLDVMGGILADAESSDKDKIAAFRAIANQVKVSQATPKDNPVAKTADQRTIESMDDEGLNRLSALTEEAHQHNEQD